MSKLRTGLLCLQTVFKWENRRLAHSSCFRVRRRESGAANNMAVKLSESELPQLMSWLQQYLPTSFKLYEDLRAHLRGRFPDVEFFTDRWPYPQAASAIVDPEGHQLECKDFYDNVNLGLFAVNKDALASLLQDKRLVDWKKTMVFSAVAESLWPMLTPLIEEQVGAVTPEYVILLKATKQDLKPIPVPEGMKISPVTDDTIGVVNSTWKFAGEGSELFIRHLVRHNPSVVLWTENGEHVGHMLGQGYGTMGMLYVQPHFRRQGYAKVIISQLAQNYFAEGDDAYVMIEEENEISEKLHHSIGFKTVPDFRVAWLRTAPKNCQPQSQKCCV